MKKIAIILGTRPEAIKLVPIYQAINRSEKLEADLISTGQHSEMIQQIFNFFEVFPDKDLKLMTFNQDLAQLSAQMLSALNDRLNESQYDFIIVQGDTTSAMIASLIGYYKKIPVGHVEAGLRTYNKFSPFPEEVNRPIIGLTADYHFAPTQLAFERLREEKVAHAFEVGNSVIDSLQWALDKVNHNKSKYDDLFAYLGSSRIVLITGHRRESFGEPFEKICEAIAELSSAHPDLSFVYPIHLNPNVQKHVSQILKDRNNVHLIDPVPYDQMIYLMSRADIILTDSGGVQEEAPSLNVPVIVMRDTTERQEGVDAGCPFLAGTRKESIVEMFNHVYKNQEVLDRINKTDNPYGDGNTSKRIVEILEGI